MAYDSVVFTRIYILVNESLNCFSKVPPNVAGADMPSEVSVLLGENVELICNANGIPTPLIQWLRDGKPITNRETERIWYVLKEIFASLIVMSSTMLYASNFTGIIANSVSLELGNHCFQKEKRENFGELAQKFSLENHSALFVCVSVVLIYQFCVRKSLHILVPPNVS